MSSPRSWWRAAVSEAAAEGRLVTAVWCTRHRVRVWAASTVKATGAPPGCAHDDLSTTNFAVSAQAVVPPLAYSLTASPTFHKPANGVSCDASKPETARRGGQSSRVTAIFRMRARRSKSSIFSRRSWQQELRLAASSKSPVGSSAPRYPRKDSSPLGPFPGRDP